MVVDGNLRFLVEVFFQRCRKFGECRSVGGVTTYLFKTTQ